mmetsp:Transcript_37847/g.88467  ORF Transcript_37847/g.88467 Transcript_37847/m.88467 type:complete len:201 (-) Transcript_37847:559-1161(-)
MDPFKPRACRSGRCTMPTCLFCRTRTSSPSQVSLPSQSTLRRCASRAQTMTPSRRCSRASTYTPSRCAWATPLAPMAISSGTTNPPQSRQSPSLKCSWPWRTCRTGRLPWRTSALGSTSSPARTAAAASSTAAPPSSQCRSRWPRSSRRWCRSCRRTARISPDSRISTSGSEASTCPCPPTATSTRPRRARPQRAARRLS